MSVQSEITRINGNIANAYTAVSGKGGTLPSARNSANLPAAIQSIPTGGGTPYAIISVTYPSGSVCTCTKGSTVLTAEGTSGKYNFGVPEAGEWVVSCTNGTDTATETVTVSTQYDGFLVNLIYALKFPIGGRIFYDDGDNGAIYTFYDAHNNVISDHTVTGLASAAYYSIAGTPSKDRWYVCNTGSLQQNREWGGYGRYIGVTIDAIGSGKVNTETMLNNLSGFTSNSIFIYIRNVRNSKLNGCDDWYILSKEEQAKLISSGLTNWYINNYMWSSVESNAYQATLWYPTAQKWDLSNKNSYVSCCCFAARSF